MLRSLASGAMTVTDFFESGLDFLYPGPVKKCQIRNRKPITNGVKDVFDAHALAHLQTQIHTLKGAYHTDAECRLFCFWISAPLHCKTRATRD